MTAAEYLKKRGWTLDLAPDGEQRWTDEFVSAPTIEFALTIQRARDAEKEREAWVAFAAGALASPVPRSNPTLAQWADDMLDAYRARFHEEVDGG